MFEDLSEQYQMMFQKIDHMSAHVFMTILEEKINNTKNKFTTCSSEKEMFLLQGRIQAMIEVSKYLDRIIKEREQIVSLNG